jgi:hypothetical protein
MAARKSAGGPRRPPSPPLEKIGGKKPAPPTEKTERASLQKLIDATLGRARREKFGNIKTQYGGQVYDSRLEARYASHLSFQQAAGEITDWCRGTPWLLLDAPRRSDRITYIPDFEVWKKGRERLQQPSFVVDTKGVLTDVFRLKAKLWKARYPDIPLIVVMADGKEKRM